MASPLVPVDPYQGQLPINLILAQQAQGDPYQATYVRPGAPSGVGLGDVFGLGATMAGARGAGGAGAAGGAAAAAAPATGRLAGAGKAGAFLASPAGRAGLYGVGGYAAGQIANKLVGEHNHTSNDEALTGALTGAGVGAGLGSLVLPGVGTAVGAGAGALLGGALGKFGPKNKGVGPADQELARQLAQVDKLASRAGLNDDAKANLALQLQAARGAVGSKTEMKAAGAQVAAMIPQIQLQAQADTQQRARALAYQAAMAPLLAQYLDRSAGSARGSQAAMDQAAGAVSGPLADAYRARGAQYVADTDASNVALASQALMAGAPKVGGQQALVQQLLAQQGQQQAASAAKKGNTVKDVGQFITGTGVADNIIQLYTMKMLMGAKGGSVGGSAGGI